MKICLETSFNVMDLLAVILAGATLVFAIYEFKIKKKWDARKIEDENWKHLQELRKEIESNLKTIIQLEKGDLSAKAVNDPVQRGRLESLEFEELVWAKDKFYLFLKDKLKNEPTTKKPAYVLYDIKEAAEKLKGLENELRKIPKEPAANAGRILVSRRLSTIKSHLQKIDKVLSVIQKSSHKVKKGN